MTTIFKLRSVCAERAAGSHVLAIETDAARTSALRHVFDSYVTADLVIVSSLTEALASIARRIPDLVLTSAFLPPREEAAITAQLKELPGTRHLQIVTIPYFIQQEVPSGARNVLRFWNRRRSLIDPFCELETVARQINEYLAQARLMRMAGSAERDDAPIHPIVVPIRRKPEPAALQDVDACTTRGGSAVGRRAIQAREADRRRAKRKQGGDVPSLWSANLPGAGGVKVVNISSHGVLLETTAKIPSGRTLDLQLVGDGTDVCLSARTTRSEVAAVDALGVRYRVAAVFSRELAIPGIEPRVAPEAVTPGALSELLARVLREIESGAPAASARRTFERGLCRLLTADDVQVRHSAIVPSRGSESFYFTVPGSGTRQAILQAVFPSDAGPSAAEYKLLRAAASLAAVVLEFAPLEEVDVRRLNG